MKKIFTILGIVSATCLVFAQTNLVPNPGFESWDSSVSPEKPTGWSFISPTGVTKETVLVHSGVAAAKMVAPATGNSSLNVDIPVSANTQYTLGYWVLDNDPNARARHWVQARTSTSNITWASDFQPSTYTSDNPAWVFVTATATTPANTELLRFDFRTYGFGAGAGTVYFDDVALVQGSVLSVMDVKTFDKEVVMNTLVNDGITFRLPMRSTVNIYTMEGRLVSSDRVSDGQTLEASHLKSGYYIVIVDNGTAKISRKILKK
ncbi:T9SS type A sorting domain-containing protein [Chryseobacterium lacus]|uniref:T9SS C-terminal target domain-containing protein n=1 Tax=Chryseobacterium lacus TaxID=2058346 RepID=A0A368N3T6_9FLAO|nr:T9SS type A sorting domain-containing protein [Chryseobacterium lacus]RCU44723.1 T9SS C-terminal target domain-containing protein [Chryseobacterium lacus]RST32387.1 T9SS type A sorting domain-containing protein [Chryseobacterium lacus]